MIANRSPARQLERKVDKADVQTGASDAVVAATRQWVNRSEGSAASHSGGSGRAAGGTGDGAIARAQSLRQRAILTRTRVGASDLLPRGRIMRRQHSQEPSQ